MPAVAFPERITQTPPVNSTRQAVSVASRTREQVQQAAMLASMAGRMFEDVKFFAYSRRTQNGDVDTPRPLLANSTLIRKACAHFDLVFSDSLGFSESSITNMDAPYPSTRPQGREADIYEYESDSDLEDEYELMEVSGAKDKDDDSESEDKYPNGNEAEDSAAVVAGPLNKDTGRLGRVVFLEDVAYVTWKAFIFYAYFDTVDFAPLRSAHKPRQKDCDPHPFKTPACSPKSMYRVAHKYDIPTLKEKAVKGIQLSLCPHNILEEIFSRFTSLYPDIQAVELNYLQSIIQEAYIQARLPIWIDALAEGQLPKGSANIVASLVNRSPTVQQPGMKRCPNGCSSSPYHCHCGSSF